MKYFKIVKILNYKKWDLWINDYVLRGFLKVNINCILVRCLKFFLIEVL